jgi:1-acyl-sn-glycerol-3-phosphate acyltransferase
MSIKQLSSVKLRATESTKSIDSVDFDRPKWQRVWILLQVFVCLSLGLSRMFVDSVFFKKRFKEKTSRVLPKQWAKKVLNLLNVKIEIEGEPFAENPSLFVSNHVGYLDILVLMAHLPNANFVSKAELRRVPFFGWGMHEIGTLFLNRSSTEARSMVAAQIVERISLEKRSLILFPEGTASYEVKPWKRGSFVVAEKSKIFVQPLSLYYRPYFKVVYAGRPFKEHLWDLLSLQSIEVKINVLKSRRVESAEDDLKEVESWVRKQVYDNLKMDNDFSQLAQGGFVVDETP